MKTENRNFSKRGHSIWDKIKEDYTDTIETYFSRDWTIINAVGNFNPHAD